MDFDYHSSMSASRHGAMMGGGQDGFKASQMPIKQRIYNIELNIKDTQKGLNDNKKES